MVALRVPMDLLAHILVLVAPSWLVEHQMVPLVKVETPLVVKQAAEAAAAIMAQDRQHGKAAVAVAAIAHRQARRALCIHQDSNRAMARLSLHGMLPVHCVLLQRAHP